MCAPVCVLGGGSLVLAELQLIPERPEGRFQPALPGKEPWIRDFGADESEPLLPWKNASARHAEG